MRAHAGSRPGAEHDAVVDELLVAPEVQGVGLGRGDVEAEEVDPEGTRPVQIGHHEVDVGHPHDVGR